MAAESSDRQRGPPSCLAPERHRNEWNFEVFRYRLESQWLHQELYKVHFYGDSATEKTASALWALLLVSIMGLWVTISNEATQPKVCLRSQTFRSGEFITWLWWLWVCLVPLNAKKRFLVVDVHLPEEIHALNKSIYYGPSQTMWNIFQEWNENPLLLVRDQLGISEQLAVLGAQSIFCLVFPASRAWMRKGRKKHVFNCWAMSRNIHILVWLLASWPYQEYECAWICSYIPYNKTI